MSMKRFKVAGHSMTPALQPGQEVVASNSSGPRPGDVVVFQHPRRSSTWLIKRLADKQGTVLSDNLEVGEDDSRTFGPVATEGMYVVIDQLNETSFVEGCELLADEDPALAEAIERFGIPEFWYREPGLRTLVWLILEQQVSLESGAAMYRRLEEATGGVSAQSIISVAVDGMRSIGVTRQKAGYLYDVADRCLTGDLDLDSMTAAKWSDARQELLSVKGIGPWTAEAYLLSALRVPDMWPVGDRALQVGAAEVLEMSKTPDEEELEIIGDPWRPIRAAAARIIWHAYLTRRGRAEPDDPTSSGTA